jgi:diguanylate cyclase (GGDEF)-like protein
MLKQSPARGDRKEMGKGTGRPVVDGTDIGVRLASIPAGVLVTFIVCAAAAADVAIYAEPGKRLALELILAVAALGAGAIGRLPWERIVRSRWREPAFLAWSLSNVATITVFGFINDSPNSALSLLFFVPIVFVSTTYPLRSVVIVSGASIAGYLGVAYHAGSTPDFVLMFAAVLFSTAMMGAWQAHNHDTVREELSRMSRTDPLTGCLNRRGFEERANEAVRLATAHGGSLAVVLVDLDGFKQVNDTGGHAAGDTVLRETAERLTAAARPGDLIGRLGGDEFAVLLHRVEEGVAAVAAERLESALTGLTRASVGTAVLPQDGRALDELIRQADKRLYEIKLCRRSPSRLDEIEMPPPGASRGLIA